MFKSAPDVGRAGLQPGALTPHTPSRLLSEWPRVRGVRTHGLSPPVNMSWLGLRSRGPARDCEYQCRPPPVTPDLRAKYTPSTPRAAGGGRTAPRLWHVRGRPRMCADPRGSAGTPSTLPVSRLS